MHLSGAIRSLYARRPLAVLVTAVLLVVIGVRPSTATEEPQIGELLDAGAFTALDLEEVRDDPEALEALCAEEPGELADGSVAWQLRALVEDSAEPEAMLAALCELLQDEAAEDDAADDAGAEDDAGADKAPDREPAADEDSAGTTGDDAATEDDGAGNDSAEGEAAGADDDAPRIPDAPAPQADPAHEPDAGDRTYRSAGHAPSPVDPAPPAPDDPIDPAGAPADAPPLDQLAMGDHAAGPGLGSVDEVPPVEPEWADDDVVEAPEIAPGPADGDLESADPVVASPLSVTGGDDTTTSAADLLPAGYLALALVAFAALRRDAAVGDRRR
jgi:hypothetical protein